MNKLIAFLWLSGVLILTSGGVQAQVATTMDSTKVYRVLKSDGGELTGRILSNDARELLMEVPGLGQVIVPKHLVTKIEEVKDARLDPSGEYFRSQEVFATRYFLTTNGLPMNKGEAYLMLSLFSFDYQYGVTDNFGVGIMTTWVGVPMIGTAKYSWNTGEKTSAGVGLLAGTGAWGMPDLYLILPFAVGTYGDRSTNINVSFGYGALRVDTETQGRYLFSVAGMAKVTNRSTLLFDSFFMPGMAEKNENSFALFMPGLRINTRRFDAWQISFAGIRYEGQYQPFFLPIVHWFRSF